MSPFCPAKTPPTVVQWIIECTPAGVMYLMYEAVQTAPARDSWEHGSCITPETLLVERAPDVTFVVEAP